MLVITAGPGNIDLSIPAVMTLAGYLAMGAMHGTRCRAARRRWSAIGIGLARRHRQCRADPGAAIPPMIGTLAAGFVMQSVAIAYSSGSTAKPAPALAQFTTRAGSRRAGHCAGVHRGRGAGRRGLPAFGVRPLGAGGGPEPARRLSRRALRSSARWPASIFYARCWRASPGCCWQAIPAAHR